MPYPIQITMKDISVSSALEKHIKKKAEKLSQYYQRILSCRVVVDVPQKHKHKGKLYRVSVELTVPGKELAVTQKINEDIYIALRDAFHAIVRQLASYVDKKRGAVKTHKSNDKGLMKKVASQEYEMINHQSFIDTQLVRLVNTMNTSLRDEEQFDYEIRYNQRLNNK